MTPSELLRKTAARIKRNGFSPHLFDGCKACFIGQMDRVGGCDQWSPEVGAAEDALADVLLDGLFLAFDENELIAHGWTDDNARMDAVAACLIAADLCEKS